MAKQPFKALQDLAAFKNQTKSIEECEMMATYALSQGKTVPPHVLKQLGDIQAIKYDMQKEIEAGNLDALDPRSLNLSLIGELYKELAVVISPASPETVLLMERNKRSGLAGMLGPVPLIRRLNIITILCLFAFLSLFFFEEVDSYTINGDILSYGGLKFVYNELVIVSIAALGASFYALFEVYKYITNDSYNPKYDSIYWIRFVLGIVSGVILAQFIFISPEILGEDVGETGGNLSKSQELGGFMTYKPLLAFLGGFSARVVHKILNSMVEAIETFISGSTRDMLVAREESAKVKMEDKINSIKQKNAQTETVERMKGAIKMMQLKEQLNSGANKDEIAAKLSEIMDEYIKPISGNEVNFKTTIPSTTTTVINNNNTVPIVENFDPTVVENFDPTIDPNHKKESPANDVDEITIPDFPEDLNNPDFPMPGDEKDVPKL